MWKKKLYLPGGAVDTTPILEKTLFCIARLYRLRLRMSVWDYDHHPVHLPCKRIDDASLFSHPTRKDRYLSYYWGDRAKGAKRRFRKPGK